MFTGIKTTSWFPLARKNIDELLLLLQAAKLQVNWDKCQIDRFEVVFTDYTSKIQAITNFAKATDTLRLRRFLGVINYYGHCIPHAVELQVPLVELSKGCTSKKFKISWTIEADSAFKHCIGQTTHQARRLDFIG